MSTLTERYVWGVLRAVPGQRRAELEPEIRALVADAIEARSAPDERRGAAPASGATAGDTAERAALTELGDPEVLAARYMDRSLHLLGPRTYLAWRRFLLVVLPIIVPFAALANMGARSLIDGADIGQAIGSGVSVAITVTMQLTFWVTVFFVAVERIDVRPASIGGDWSLDDLPSLPDPRQPHPFELALSVAGQTVGAVVIIWQQVASPVQVDGRSISLFDPAMWSFWLPWFLVVAGLEIVFTALVYRTGRWTWPLAAADVMLAGAFAIPAVWLAATGQLFDPSAVRALATAGLGGAVAPTIAIIAVAATVAGSAIEASRNAYRSWRPRPAPVR